MGIDYRANFGIGVKVKRIDFEHEDCPADLFPYGCMPDYLEAKLPDGLRWVEVVASDYVVRDNDYSVDYYVVLKSPFADDMSRLACKIDAMKAELLVAGIETEGKVDVVGGLYIS